MMAKKTGADPATIQLLEKVSGDFTQKIIKQKMLGHRFGLEGEISDGKQSLDFTGFDPFFTFPELAKSLDHHFPPYPKELTKEDINTIKEAFENSWTSDQPRKIKRLIPKKLFRIFKIIN